VEEVRHNGSPHDALSAMNWYINRGHLAVMTPMREWMKFRRMYSWRRKL